MDLLDRLIKRYGLAMIVGGIAAACWFELDTRIAVVGFSIAGLLLIGTLCDQVREMSARRAEQRICRLETKLHLDRAARRLIDHTTVSDGSPRRTVAEFDQARLRAMRPSRRIREYESLALDAIADGEYELAEEYLQHGRNTLHARTDGIRRSA